MKVILEKPDKYHMYDADIFKYWLMKNDVYIGSNFEMSWNDFHEFYDIIIHDDKHLCRKYPDRILQIIEFLKKDYRINCENIYFDYDSDKRYVSMVRIWVYLDGKTELSKFPKWYINE